MGHAKLIGHNLMGVFAVWLEYVLMQHQSVDYGQDGVDSVYGKENEIPNLPGGHYQRTQHEQQNEGYRHRTHIASEASCPFSEIEYAEYEHANADYINH